MEFIVEFIMEVVLGSAIEAAASSKVAKRVRIALLIVITLLYGAFFGLFVMVCINTDEIIIEGITILLGLLLLYVLGRMWIRTIKGLPMRDWEE